MLRTLEGLLWTTRNLTPEFGVDCIFMHSLPSQANHDANMDSPSLQQQPTGPSYNLRLPLELCEYIIDFLWDDLDALEACALAYPVFATRADYRMDDISRANCLTNEAAMNSLSRDLFASSAYSRYFDTLKIRVEEYASWCPSVPLRLGPKLSRLNQLELIGVFTSHKTHYDTTKHFSLFRSITILRLADCTFPKFADFARFIIAFPNLSTLEINDVDWDEYLVLQHILGKSRTKKFHIKDLYIDVSIGRVDYLGQLFNWLITTPAPKTITTLSIQIRFVEDIAPITKFLKTSGEVLRQLKIYTQPGLMQRAQISGSDLSLTNVLPDCVTSFYDSYRRQLISRKSIVPTAHHIRRRRSSRYIHIPFHPILRKARSRENILGYEGI